LILPLASGVTFDIVVIASLPVGETLDERDAISFSVYVLAGFSPPMITLLTPVGSQGRAKEHLPCQVISLNTILHIPVLQQTITSNHDLTTNKAGVGVYCVSEGYDTSSGTSQTW